ncbi:MAG: hypothetical protein HC927_03995 [Deltaproteobacteria bacterium]|nr:hypothetical protein [Deltaproteobacteria bacterium]
MSLPSRELVTWWKPKLRALDPWRTLGVDEIEALYAERRGEPAVYRALATQLVMVDRPADLKVLLCGARGSGKSTEITRLAREIQQEFCVVQTDLGEGLPDNAGTLAVVMVLGVAGLHALQTWSEPDAEAKALVKQDNDRVQRGTERLQAALSKFGDAMPSVADILGGISSIVTLLNPAAGVVVAGTGAAVKATSGSGSKLRNSLARGPLEGRLPVDQRDNAKAVIDAVNEIFADLHSLAGRPPLLLADGLDRKTSVEDVELALSDEQLLRDLDAALVITGPVNLRHDPRFRATPGNFKLKILYNVPVCRRTDHGVEADREGIQMLCDLYERRRHAAGIPKDLIPAPLLERAAYMCAGIVREFLLLLYEACNSAIRKGRHSVEPDDLEEAIKSHRLAMEGYLDEARISILRRVLDKGIVPSGPVADRLLFENFIACYPNGDVWFRPHEVLVDYIKSKSTDEPAKV